MPPAFQYTIFPVDDTCVTIRFGDQINQQTNEVVQAVSTYLEKYPFPWMSEYVPSFSAITVYYHPLKVLNHVGNLTVAPYQYVIREVKEALKQLDISSLIKEKSPQTIDIPVCYGEDLGPDLEFVAKQNSLTSEEVINIHSKGEYLVYMIGFAPGFPYLGGMSEEIATPRRSSPRQKTPAGSVGIAGNQTGVYPIETPGGWQLIGQTPLQLFRPDKQPPSVIKAGDRIRFRPISRKEFDQWEASSNEY